MEGGTATQLGSYQAIGTVMMGMKVLNRSSFCSLPLQVGCTSLSDPLQQMFFW